MGCVKISSNLDDENDQLDDVERKKSPFEQTQEEADEKTTKPLERVSIEIDQLMGGNPSFPFMYHEIVEKLLNISKEKKWETNVDHPKLMTIDLIPSLPKPFSTKAGSTFMFYYEFSFSSLFEDEKMSFWLRYDYD